ncbi:MAG: hypothetical protein JO152_16725 [Mycobacteriaceae bacterium]|nr:hypothetical protein [Mycobacteriaceae bacterium]
MRALIALLSVAVLVLGAACSDADPNANPYGAESAKMGESLALLGWNMGLSNLRWDGDHVLVDVDAAPSQQGKPHAKPEELRFGLYGALDHPVEADGIGSCNGVAGPGVNALAAPHPDRLTGTVCLGPLQNQSEVRGVYAYSPHDRIPQTAAAYAVAFPVGVLPTNENDTGGLVVKTTSVDAWRADGTQVIQADLDDPNTFTGNGYMLLGLDASGLSARYRDESVHRGGPMMIVVSPTLPAGQGLSHACAVYGSSVVVLPDSKLGAVHVAASLCTQGEINEALLYANLSVVGTHAAVWTSRD